MTTEHTPGPWYRGARGTKDIQIITVDPKTEEPGAVVAYVNRVAWCNEEIARANAKLIAAAPDLLDALKTFLAFYNDLSKSNPGFLGKLCLQDYAQFNEALLKAPAAIAKATP